MTIKIKRIVDVFTVDGLFSGVELSHPSFGIRRYSDPISAKFVNGALVLGEDRYRLNEFSQNATSLRALLVKSSEGNVPQEVSSGFTFAQLYSIQTLGI